MELKALYMSLAFTKWFKWPNRKYFEFFALFISFCLRDTNEIILWLLYYTCCQTNEKQWLSQKYIMKFTKYSKMTIAQRREAGKGDVDGQQNYIRDLKHIMLWKWQLFPLTPMPDSNSGLMHTVFVCKSNEILATWTKKKLYEFLINIFVYTFSTC